MNSQWDKYFLEALRAADDAAARRLRGGGREATQGVIDFGSNDYLGLSRSTFVRERMTEILGRSGWGSGGSAVLGGYTAHHAELETSLARLCATEAAVVFASGYAGNVGTVASLAGSGDAIYSDQLNHASLIDGARLSRAERVIFPHQDAEFLETHLRANRHRYRRVLLLTETVFSMDGDCAQLEMLAGLAQRYDCGLVIDEAHATGVYGQFGEGLWGEVARSLRGPTPIVVKLGTLSKAIGGIGGYATGSTAAIEYLVNHCRSYLFSTSPPAAAVAASTVAIEIMRGMNHERARLRFASQQLRLRLQSFGCSVPTGDSPIIPVIVGAEADALRLSNQLLDAGLYVPAIRPPTVPADSSRLRISLTSKHTEEQIEQLVACLAAKI